jgi:hypothetical protein
LGVGEISETPSQSIKLSVVAPGTYEAVGRRIVSETSPRKKKK